MKVLRWILMVVVILLILVIGIGLMLPRRVAVTTTEEISLPPQKVFHFVAAFVDRTAWDPWIKADTAATCSFDVKQGYVGSVYEWDGPGVGKGMMKVDSVVSGSYIRNKVSFAKGNPLPEEWIFSPAENGTEVTWTITLEAGSAIGRITNNLLKGVIQKTIDSGIAGMKEYLETHGVTMAEVSEIGTEEFPAITALVCSGTGNTDKVASMLGEYYDKILAHIKEENIQPQGMPFALYTDFVPETGEFNITAGIAVASGVKGNADVRVMKYQSFFAVRGVHTGPYEDMETSYDALNKYCAGNNLIPTGEVWEFYHNDPSQVEDLSLLKTTIAMKVVPAPPPPPAN